MLTTHLIRQGERGASRDQGGQAAREAPDRPIVLIVDDEPDMREGLRWLIASAGWHAVAFEGAHELLDFDLDTAACLLLDVRMPDVSGLELQDELRRRGATLPIIMMSAYAEVPMVVRALKAGAVDFLQKPIDREMLVERVKQAIEVSARARAEILQQRRMAARLERLTPRQRQIVSSLAAGKASKVIASELGLSPKTVDVHRARIMEKLEAESLPDLFRLLALVPRRSR